MSGDEVFASFVPPPCFFLGSWQWRVVVFPNQISMSTSLIPPGFCIAPLPPLLVSSPSLILLLSPTSIFFLFYLPLCLLLSSSSLPPPRSLHTPAFSSFCLYKILGPISKSIERNHHFLGKMMVYINYQIGSIYFFYLTFQVAMVSYYIGQTSNSRCAGKGSTSCFKSNLVVVVVVVVVVLLWFSVYGRHSTLKNKILKDKEVFLIFIFNLDCVKDSEKRVWKGKSTRVNIFEIVF